MRRPIPYGRQSIEEDDIASVIEALKGDFLTTGPSVKEFEERFADYVGAKYAVALVNGTAGLHLACLVAGFGKGDNIITSSMTFAASANSIIYTGATPVFADIDEETYNINPIEIKKKITPKTKGLIPVHYTGLPCNLEEIQVIAKEYNLTIIEDACHALGSKYKGEKIGNCAFSDMTVFSFHPVKHITTGEGGMVTTNKQELYEKLLLLRAHGITKDPVRLEQNHGLWYHEMQELGYNYRITDFQCALGISQLKKVDKFIKRRREIVSRYNQAFEKLNVQLPSEPEGYYNAYHLYVLKLANSSKINRKELYDKLRAENIHCQVHFIPVHLYPYYRKNLLYSNGDFPITESHYERIISLPLFPSMTDEEIDWVISKVVDILS